MRYTSLIALAAAACCLVTTCARDKTVGAPTTAEPIEIILTFSTQGEFTSDFYYFLVFNFTNSPSITDDARPIWEVSGDDRGKNWERYIMMHINEAGQKEVFALTKAETAAFNAVGTSPKAIAAVDLNADGIEDLVTANSLSDDISVSLGAETGTFGAHNEYAAGDEPIAVVPFMLDADENVDLVVSNHADTEEGRSLSFLRGKGDGTFYPATTLELPAQPYGLAVADFTGDGLDDIAVALYTDGEEGNRIAVIPKTDAGLGDPIFTPAGVNPTTIRAADIDGDEHRDLAVVNSYDGDGGDSLMLLAGNGDGSFTLAHTFDTDPSPLGLAVGDLNSDELDDFVVTSTMDADPGNTIMIVRSNAGGGYGSPELLKVGSSPTDAIIGLFNDDTAPDIVVVESADAEQGNQVRLLLQNESGGFATSQRVPVGRRPWAGVRLDFNGDGHLDLAVANSYDGPDGNSVALLRGTSEGQLEGAISYWTDEMPENINTVTWDQGITIGRNSITVRLDPVLFTDLTDTIPDDFLVDFMVFDTGIDITRNPDNEGVVYDYLLRPIVVKEIVGFEADEAEYQYEPQGNENVPVEPPDAADIVDWRVEVN